MKNITTFVDVESSRGDLEVVEDGNRPKLELFYMYPPSK